MLYDIQSLEYLQATAKVSDLSRVHLDISYRDFSCLVKPFRVVPVNLSCQVNEILLRLLLILIGEVIEIYEELVHQLLYQACIREIVVLQTEVDYVEQIAEISLGEGFIALRQSTGREAV